MGQGRHPPPQKKRGEEKTSPIDDGRLCRRAAEWRAFGRRLLTFLCPHLSGKTQIRLTPVVGAVDWLVGERLAQHIADSFFRRNKQQSLPSVGRFPLSSTLCRREDEKNTYLVLSHLVFSPSLFSPPPQKTGLPPGPEARLGRRQGLGQRGRRRCHRQGHPAEGKREEKKKFSRPRGLSFFFSSSSFFPSSPSSWLTLSPRPSTSSGTPSRTSPRPSSTRAAPSCSSGSPRPSSAPSTPCRCCPSCSSSSASATRHGSCTATCCSSRAARSCWPTSRSLRRRSPPRCCSLSFSLRPFRKTLCCEAWVLENRN